MASRPRQTSLTWKGFCGQRRVRRVSTHRGTGGRNGRDHSRTISWESEAVLRADQIRTLQAGMALVLWSRLPPVLAHLPLLSEQPDWQQVQQEEEQARQANDRARSAACPHKRRYPASERLPGSEGFPGREGFPGSEGFPGREVLPGAASFPDGPVPIPATFPSSSPIN